MGISCMFEVDTYAAFIKNIFLLPKVLICFDRYSIVAKKNENKILGTAYVKYYN